MADAQQPLLPGNGADVDGAGDARESSAAAAAVKARLEASASSTCCLQPPMFHAAVH